MKPRTKLQVQVFNLSKNLLPITAEQKHWAIKNCLDHIAYRTKKNVSCLDCGNVWDGPKTAKQCKCPQCGISLKIRDTRKKIFKQSRVTMAIVDVVEEFQLVRIFEINAYKRAGWLPDIHIWEVVQQWFVPRGKLTIVARTSSFGNYGWYGNLEIRKNYGSYYSDNKYNIYVDKIYKDIKCLPIYKRNGFSAKLEVVYIYSFLQKLLVDRKLETLVKTGQYGLAACKTGNISEKVYAYWNSIKICIRRNYIVKDAITWLDYLDLLVYFQKDVKNDKFICPKNLHLEHNKLVAKKTAILNRQQDLRNIENAKREQLNLQAAELAYQKNKSAFFDLMFSKGDLTIQVLKSIDEFKEEAKAHGHCVFTNAYYQKNDSLILSARIGNKPVETIEIILSKMKIAQSRGLGNKATEYNKEIIELVKKNIPVIKQKYKQSRTAAA